MIIIHINYMFIGEYIHNIIYNKIKLYIYMHIRDYYILIIAL